MLIFYAYFIGEIWMFRKSKLQTLFGYLTALQLLYNLTVGVVLFPVSRNTRKPNLTHNLISFEGEIHDYNVEINFAHLSL